MKKAYTLLITIILITSFSVLGVFIMQTKALKSQNLTNQYLNIQGKISQINLRVKLHLSGNVSDRTMKAAEAYAWQFIPLILQFYI